MGRTFVRVLYEVRLFFAELNDLEIWFAISVIGPTREYVASGNNR